MDHWAHETLPQATSDVGQLTRDLDTYGYCLIADAIAEADLQAVQHRLEQQARAEQEQGHHQFSDVQDPGGINQWVYMLINKGEVFQKLLFQPQVTAMLEHLLGSEHVLSDFSAHITRPGNTLLPLHIDQWWLPSPRLPGDPHIKPGDIGRTKVETIDGVPSRSTTPINPPVVVNAMWMITDYTEQNGATRLVPGSHLSGLQPKQCVPHACPTVPAVGKAGTVILWDGRTWHAAGANNSDAPRYGVTSYYSGPQFRSLSNWTLGAKPDVLAQASPELLTLLGFKPFGGYGHTGTRGGEFAKSAEYGIGELEP